MEKNDEMNLADPLGELLKILDLYQFGDLIWEDYESGRNEDALADHTIYDMAVCDLRRMVENGRKQNLDS